MLSRSFLWGAIGLLSLAAAATGGSDNSKKLIGVWQRTITDGVEKGLTIEYEFAKDGKLTIRSGDRVLATGIESYRVKEDKIIFKSKREVKGKTGEVKGKTAVEERESTWTIKKLSEKELHVTDDEQAEGRKNMELKRVK